MGEYCFAFLYNVFSTSVLIITPEGALGVMREGRGKVSMSIDMYVQCSGCQCLCKSLVDFLETVKGAFLASAYFVFLYTCTCTTIGFHLFCRPSHVQL